MGRVEVAGPKLSIDRMGSGLKGSDSVGLSALKFMGSMGISRSCFGFRECFLRRVWGLRF